LKTGSPASRVLPASLALQDPHPACLAVSLALPASPVFQASCLMAVLAACVVYGLAALLAAPEGSSAPG
jgi:hypothetical protein